MVEQSLNAVTQSASSAEYPELPAPLGRTLLFLGTALSLSLGLCWCLGGDEYPPETGFITGRSTALVSDWSGRIDRFLVKSGDTIQVGDPLAVLINEQLLLKLDRQRRELHEIRRALESAETTMDVELAKQLHAIDAEIVVLKTRKETDASHLLALESRRFEVAHRLREQYGIPRIRAELALAESKLQNLQAQPQELTLPAPVGGTVGKLLRKPGERVVPGTKLLEMADQDEPLLIVEVPEPTAKRFALGDTIPLGFPGKEDRLGRVANMELMESQPGTDSAKETKVRLEIEPLNDEWPELPFQSPVDVRTSDSKAMSRRVH